MIKNPNPNIINILKKRQKNWKFYEIVSCIQIIRIIKTLKIYIRLINDMMPHKMKIGEDIINMYKPYQNYSANWKTITVGKQDFEIYGRYEPVDVIGKGAYGVVVAAKDHQAKSPDKQLVAIKKIDKSFEHKIFAKRTLRQLKLQRLLQHQNILSIDTIILPKSRQLFEDVYVISSMMDHDLTEYIKNPKQPLEQTHQQYFLYQILRGLKFIHSAKIIHRDLKPRNILVNQQGDLKICDFGLARANLKQVKANVLTDYVTTRWYRAPQLLLSASQYTSAVDMWSVGCIFAEMLKRVPFLPGKDTQNQIQLICNYLDCPEIDNIKFISEASKKMIKQLQKKKKNNVDLAKVFPKASQQALDLLKKLLTFDPQKRITVNQAIAHPFFGQLRDQSDEPTRGELDPLQFQFQDYNMTTQQYKDLLYEQILLYNSKNFCEQYFKKLKNKQSVISHIINNSNQTNIDPRADQDD